MSVKVNTRQIDVLTFFENGKIDPIKFRLDGKVYPVKRVSKQWTEENGKNSLHNFIVETDSAANYQLQFDSHQFTWQLQPFSEAVN